MRWPLHLMLLAMLLAAGCGSRTGGLPAPVVDSEDINRYVVQPGDSLHSIAWGLSLDPQLLARLNHLSPPYHVKPGQELQLVPGTAQARSVIERGIPPGVLDWREPRSDLPPPKSDLHWQWPVAGRAQRRDSGLFISGQPGELVHAAELGEVVYSGNGLKGFGNLVIIKHRHDYLSAYGFNRALLVTQGDRVVRGTPIAEMGADRSRTGLYFEIRHKARPLNPLDLLPRPINR